MSANTSTPVPTRASGQFGVLSVVLVTLLAIAVAGVIALAITAGSLSIQLSSARSGLHAANAKITESGDAREACVFELNGVLEAYNNMTAAADLYASAAGEAPTNLTKAITDVAQANTARAQAQTAYAKAGEGC